MKYSTILKYLLTLLLIGILLICGSVLLETHYSQAHRKFEYNPVYITMIKFIFFGGIGALLGLENTANILKERKKIKINKLKLFILGVPSFIVSMTYIWLSIGMINEEFIFLPFILVNDHIIMISAVIFGHTLITSLKTDMQGDMNNEKNV